MKAMGRKIMNRKVHPPLRHREWVSEKNKQARQRGTHHSKVGFLGIMNGILGGVKIVKEKDLSPGRPDVD